MKRIILIFFIVIMIIYDFSCKNSNIFLVYENSSNLLLYNKYIDKKEIKNFINNYSDIIYSFYNKNNLTNKTILDENLTIILCKENFNEIVDDKYNIQKLLKQKLKKI